MRKLRVYMAGAYVDAERLVGVKRRMQEIGFEVTSRWIGKAAAGKPYESDFSDEAKVDYADIDKADFLIIDTFGKTRGGREWEGGYAIGKGKRVMVVGPVIHPFHAMCRLRFPDWEAALAYLAQRLEHGDVRED